MYCITLIVDDGSDANKNNPCDILFMLKSCLMLAHICCSMHSRICNLLPFCMLQTFMISCCFVWVEKIFLQRTISNVKLLGQSILPKYTDLCTSIRRKTIQSRPK